MLLQGEMQDEKSCFSLLICFETRPQIKTLLRYSILSSSVEQVIQVQLWKMKSLCSELELAPNWHAWSVNRASWGCLHQLIQKSLRQRLETKHHFFRSLYLYSHRPGLWEAQEEGVCSPLARMDAGKNYSWPRLEGLGGVWRLPSKSSLARPSADTINLVLRLLSLCICPTWVIL